MGADELSKSQIFIRRLSSSLFLWGLLLAGLFYKDRTIADGAFILLLALLVTSGLWEFFALAKFTGLSSHRTLGVIGGMALVGTVFYLSAKGSSRSSVAESEILILALMLISTTLWHLFRGEIGKGIQSISITFLGVLYVALLLGFFTKMRFYEGIKGEWFLLYFILITKASDTGAYLTGSLIGRHKMIPRISPGKTWEGFAGAIILSIIASALMKKYAGHHLIGMTWTHTIALGAGLGVTAVLGDLVESLFKREAGQKDSGHLFPGLGGILDVLDSLLLNAPIMYIYIRCVYP